MYLITYDLIYYCCSSRASEFLDAVNHNRIETLLTNGLITFFINGNPVFNNGPRSLPMILPDCTILDS